MTYQLAKFTVDRQAFGLLDDPVITVIEWIQDNTAKLIKEALLRFSGPVGALAKLDRSPTEFFEETLVRASGGFLGATLAALGGGPVLASAIVASGIASIVREELLEVIDANPHTEGLAFAKSATLVQEFFDQIRGISDVEKLRKILEEAEEMRLDFVSERDYMLVVDEIESKIQLGFTKRERTFQCSPEFRAMF